MVQTGHRQRRHHHRDGEQERRRPFEERLQPQPEIKPDAGVRPRHRQQDELHRDHVRPRHPIGKQWQLVMRRAAAENQSGQAHGAEMTGEQKRNAQAQDELGDFGRGVAEMPALIERPQAERHMRDRRGIERGVDDRDAPPPDVEVPPPIHGREGNIAERVIEEMREDVGEHHQAAGDAHLPHADAAQPRRYLRRGFCAGRAHINDRRCLQRHASPTLPTGRVISGCWMRAVPPLP